MGLGLLCILHFLLLPLIHAHSLLVMDYKFSEYFPHKLIMLFHKPLLLNNLSTPLRTTLFLFLPHQILKNAFHVFVVLGDGKPAKLYKVEL